ncbi:MAG TPA: alternative ribosome rescue aminoacyl-tRNA hydrolase ArfB [Streptosporangiaceae bacterium]|nr:alternative ribosome rescue aminoacyl-tRNA hydrolase ArfB [Streptosporangiaceae bacterium]
MPEDIHVRGAAVIPDSELRWRFSRSSGPGGQHVNKTDTAVELSFDLASTDSLPAALKERAMRRLAGRLVDGVLTVRAERHRSQWRNRQDALSRLAALLHESTAPPPKRRRPTKPSRAQRERRLAAKRRQSELKRLRRPPD